MPTGSIPTAPAPGGRPATRSIAILPLRLFLGVTFADAGLGKLLSAAYLSSGPQGFAAQARGFAHASPIGWAVRAVALRHPEPVGLLLALAELAVGLLTLAGLACRMAAAGGLAFSLLFFLTASWHTRPFFYGADLPFAMGWLVLLLAGDAGLPSVDRWLARRQRAVTGLRDDRLVAVPLDRVQEVCAAADQRGRCPGMARGCRGQHCPPAPPPAGAGRRARASAVSATSVSAKPPPSPLPTAGQPSSCGSAGPTWWPTAPSARTQAAPSAMTRSRGCWPARATARSSTRAVVPPWSRGPPPAPCPASPCRWARTVGSTSRPPGEFWRRIWSAPVIGFASGRTTMHETVASDAVPRRTACLSE